MEVGTYFIKYNGSDDPGKREALDHANIRLSRKSRGDNEIGSVIGSGKVALLRKQRDDDDAGVVDDD